MSAGHEIFIVDAQRFRGDLIVTFSDNTTAIYRHQFLYDIRNHEANPQLPELSPTVLQDAEE